MALEVDIALSDTSQMEQRNSGRSKSRIPMFIRSSQARCFTQAGDGSEQPQNQTIKDSNREKHAGRKAVSMAPTSRYMTGRSLYTARKPLISAEHQISILKNPLIHQSTESVHESTVASIQTKNNAINYNKSDKCDQESKNVSQMTASSPSLSREDPSASLSTLELRLNSSEFEHPNFSPVPSTCKCERWNLSITPIDKPDLTAPLSPKWTFSQQTSHLLSTHTSPFQKTKTRAPRQEEETMPQQSYNKSSLSELKNMSPYQVNYWACAIPRSLPPSPDRKSLSWDPDLEYQNLLDYTYPLRPNTADTWSSDVGKSLLQGDTLLPDSGIELDSFLSSSSLSCLDQPGSEIRYFEDESAQRFQSLNLRKPSEFRFSEVGMSSSPYSSMAQKGLPTESLYLEGKSNIDYRKVNSIYSTSKSPTFLKSACILPCPRSLGAWDEEFFPLPDQLQELQGLSQQLKDLTVQISQPYTSSLESLQRDFASVRSSSAQLEKQATDFSIEQENKDHGSVVKVSLRNEDLSVEVKGLDGKVPTTSSQVNRGSLKVVETIMNQTSLCELQRRTAPDMVEEENRESVLHNLQAFCSNLEKLIWWLYKVAEKMPILPPPLLDIESLKASLADYEGFQKDVQAHRPLTTSVLQTGDMLLCCMNSASPFLRETLMLIEKQSHVLETHAEHLFSSILSAMDRLAKENVQNSAAERTS